MPTAKELLITACQSLVRAYRLGLAKGGTVDWDDIDAAHATAIKALDQVECEERGTFKPVDKHSDWCEDGIEYENNGPTQLWRLDISDEIQVQLFARSVHGEEAIEYIGTDLLIEYDKRDPLQCDRRIYYTFRSWPIDSSKAKALLEMDKETVAAMLSDKIAQVKAQDNMPKYCN